MDDVHVLFYSSRTEYHTLLLNEGTHSTFLVNLLLTSTFYVSTDYF